MLRHRGRVHALTARPAFAGWPGRLVMRGRHVSELVHELQRVVRGRLALVWRRLDQFDRRLEARDLRRRVGSTRTRLATARSRLDAAVIRSRHTSRTRLGTLAARLESLSPLAVLGRGYAVCWDGERQAILRDAAAVADGAAIRVTLARGELRARVTARFPDEESEALGPA
jgi:exodeoxyribonuclease VII large subunit